MRKHWFLFVALAACLAVTAAMQITILHGSAGGAEPAPADRALVLKLFDASPALFVKNEGQWADASIRYGFHGSGANVLFTDDGLRLQVFRREAVEKPTKPTGDDAPFTPPHDRFRAERPPTQFTELSVRFDGANQVAPVGLEQNHAVFNYYIGEKANWRTGVPTYRTVAYEGLYDGIDLHTRGRRNGLKYEFHVAPGADYRQIRISYRGINGLYIDADGALHVASELGELVDEAPYIYQDIGGQRIEVAGRFELVDADTYTFSITGAYDPQAELVIDPDLVWSSFLGGGMNDVAIGIAVDGAGNAFITGETFSSDFPTPGGFDTSYNGSGDAFVAKVGHAPQIEALELFYEGRFGNAADPAKEFLAVGEASQISVVGNDLHGNVTNYAQGITGIRVTFDRVVTFSVDAAAAFSYEATPEQDPSKVFSAFVPSPPPTYVVDDGTGKTVVTITFESGQIKNRWLKTIIDASQVSANGLNLDGELPSPLTLPSGDGTAGGNAEFIIGSRIGDVDANYYTLFNDAIGIRSRAGAALVGISNAYDIDKSGRVLLNDAILTRNAVSGTALPALP